MESNDSPEIPDRGETSDILGLPSGGMCTIDPLKYFQNPRLFRSASLTKTQNQEHFRNLAVFIYMAKKRTETA